jgi:multicomponent Na+:H+ antiporter subunit A
MKFGGVERVSATGMTTAALFLPLLGAFVAPALTRRLQEKAAWVLALFLAAPFVIFASHLPEVAGGAAVTGGFAWAPMVGLDYAWRLDGLGLTFALLISGIGVLVVLYSGGYLKGHEQQGRFFAFILLFSFAMLGVVVSDNLLMLFVYWEVTSISSFLLIGFDHQRAASRRGALQALLVTGGGGLALLAGVMTLTVMSGETTLSGLIAKAAEVTAHPWASAALVLVLIGAFTKSAQFPFHFWLPNAMEAPTPVSAFLHSATMVKAGVYLLLRLNPVFGNTVIWQIALPLFGGVTLVIGAALALKQTDLKLMLAYTTVASLGLITMMTGIGSDKAIEAAVLYLIAHALFKGALFMIAGVIDHEAGTRDVTKLSGLRGKMPLTFAAALLAACSMAGIPLFAGFMAKEEIYAALTAGGWNVLPLMAAIAGNAMMGAIGFAIALLPFLGAETKTPKHAHDGPLLLMAGPVALAALGLVAGLASGPFHHLLSSPMASAAAGTALDVHASPLPHVSLAFALSVLTLALAAVMLWGLAGLRGLMARLLTTIGWGPDRGFDQFVSLLVTVSHAGLNRLQSGRLELYLTTVFAFIAASLLLPMGIHGEWPDIPAWPRDLQPHEAGFIAIAIFGLFAVLAAKSRLTAIVSLGIQGFAVAVLYLLFGAPDLAFTQFMVETLSVVILALIMTRLRLDVSDHRPLSQIILDTVIAVACGLGFALYLLKVLETPFDNTLSAFFGDYSKTLAHGANVVNVIIVDFRGSDTLGEIAVVTITGLAILALIRLRTSHAAPADNDPDREEERA